MKKKNFYIIGGIIIIFELVLNIYFFLYKKISLPPRTNQQTREESNEYIKTQPIETGDIYNTVMQNSGVATSTRMAIFKATENIYDLATIKAGKNFYLTYNKKTNDLVQIMYPINDLEELYVKKDLSTIAPAKADNATTTSNTWVAERKKIDYKIKLKTIKGEIKNSLYQDALSLGVEEGTIIEFANIFEYAIDYAYDIRTGDTFQFVYEERYRDGKYIMPGRILAGKFINASTTYMAYYFEENEDNKGYFDEKGNALQKMFLRAPVAFRYISSGFTTGLRYIQAFNISTGHRAIDYAAAYGTPIRAVADGTVTFAGWSKAGYGNLVSIRHNSTYSTNYAHQSKIIVKRGQHVKQGQIIGYVGSTGLSTGPHLHYELVKNGAKINPLKEVLPPGKPLGKDGMEKYKITIKPFQKMLE